MSSSTRSLVTANFERGKPAAWDWLERSVRQERKPAVVFGQELAGGERLEALAADHGYAIVWPQVELNPRWWVVSWLMIDRDLNPEAISDEDLHTRLLPHGSYSAAARVDWPGLGELTLMSLHASPHPVPVEEIDSYPDGLPPPRRGGEGVAYAGRHFYSDLLLDAVAHAAARGPVLAAGDLNEARAWDARNPGETWGTEFFDSVPSVGLHDVTFGLWGEERRTRFHATHPGYQLDVVLASPNVSARVTQAEVDDRWTTDAVSTEGLSDHAPVWFGMKTG